MANRKAGKRTKSKPIPKVDPAMTYSESFGEYASICFSGGRHE